MSDSTVATSQLKDASVEDCPDVSIIILNLNQPDLTVKCVDSVRQHTANGICEIIVVDNGSVPEKARRLQQSLSPNIRFIPLKQNMFFGEGNNIAAEKARGKFLLFLNNDVTFAENVVDKLLVAFRSCFAAGAIGPKFLYPDGALQEAGGFIRRDGWPVQQGKGELILDSHFEQGCHIVDYCSAACLMVERDVFLKLGGFDPIFEPAYFEDCDLCLRIRSLGLFTYFFSDTTVYHEENTTASTLWPDERVSEIALKNRETFFQRWGAYLERRLTQDVPFPIPFEPLHEHVETERSIRGKAVALCNHSAIGADDISLSMLRCAGALQKIYRITIVAPEPCSKLRIRSLCRLVGVDLADFSIVGSFALDETQFEHVLRFGEDSSNRHNIETLKTIFHRL